MRARFSTRFERRNLYYENYTGDNSSEGDAARFQSYLCAARRPNIGAEHEHNAEWGQYAVEQANDDYDSKPADDYQSNHYDEPASTNQQHTDHQRNRPYVDSDRRGGAAGNPADSHTLHARALTRQ